MVGDWQRFISGTDSSRLSLEEWDALVPVTRIWPIVSYIWFSRGDWEGTQVEAVLYRLGIDGSGFSLDSCDPLFPVFYLWPIVNTVWVSLGAWEGNQAKASSLES